MLWIGRSILDSRYCSGYSKYIPEYFRGTRNLLTEKIRENYYLPIAPI